MPAKKPTGSKISQGELVEILATKLGLPNAQVSKVVIGMQDEITAQLYKGNEVGLSIGKFVRRDRKAGTGRNPSTGESIKVAAAKGAGFQIGTRLKKALNDAA